MEKFIKTFMFLFIFCNTSFAETYYFKQCKLSNIASGDYIIDLKKKTIETNLQTTDGRTQRFFDKIKIIENDQIITEKIPSGKGDEIYFEYYLNLKNNSVIKLQYKKQSGLDLDIYKIQEQKVSKCLDVKGGWDKDEIEKVEIDKEQEQIEKAQKKIKKEQNLTVKCVGKDHTIWTNCIGLFKSITGHVYDGMFKNGEILKGTALFPGGAKYAGDFKNYKPHGYGNFSWSNGDKFFGEWNNGKINGRGTKIWNDGREYAGDFKNDKLHGNGTFYYPDGKRYQGSFINGKRHGDGTFTYPDGTAFLGNWIAGKQEGLGECVGLDGDITPCNSKNDSQPKNFSGENTYNINIVAKKWVRISQFESNTKKGKKVMDKLRGDFEIKALELCSPKSDYKELAKRIEVLEIDETPAYGLETKLKIAITGAIECKES